jgi:L-rhamnose mutarotase
MSYLEVREYTSDVDVFLENCFNYAYEREDECLFESMILNELSDELKLSAAHKALISAGADKNFVYSDLENVKKFKDGESRSKTLANFYSGEAQNNLSNYGKYLSGKRNRLFNYYLDSDNGTKYNAFDQDKEVDEYHKNIIRKLLNNQHNTDIQQEYENLRSEVESLNKDNPQLELNKFGKPLHKMPKIKVTEMNKNNRTKSLPAKLKQKIRVFIKSLKRKYNNIKRKINNTPPEQRSLLQKFMHKIIQIIDKVSGWLKKKGE